MLEIRRLRLLHALATHGTVAAAAAAMHLSGPAVSQQLAVLERETGIQLVERVGRRLRLTEAGWVLVAHTRIVLDQLAAAEADLIALGTEFAGTVRLCAFSSAVATLVADAWRSLRAAHGTMMQLQIATMEPEESLPVLQRGDADVVIAYSYELAPRPLPAAVERRELLADPVVIAVPRDDPLCTAAEPIDLARLADRDWLAPHPASACHQMVERACNIAGFVPRTTVYCADFPAMLALVAVGAGIALVPQLAAYQVADGVVLRPITPVTVRQVFALTRPDGDRQAAARVALDHLNAAASARS